MSPRKHFMMWRHTRKVDDPEERQAIREAIAAGLPAEFRLPYPYPRNEHEDGMNWVSVNAVVSGRADW